MKKLWPIIINVSSINLAEEWRSVCAMVSLIGKIWWLYILHGTVIHIMLPLLTVSSTLNGVVTWHENRRAHEVPEKPIDSYSYDKGVFCGYPFRQATEWLESGG